MPHPSCFAKMLVSPGQAMRLSLKDARNFYYLLAVPPERLPFQGIGPAVDAGWWNAGCPALGEAWPELWVFPDTRELEEALRVVKGDVKQLPSGLRELEARLVQPVLAGVMMGDINGVVVGQEVHLAMIESTDALEPGELVVLGQAAPRSGDEALWAGVYIDGVGGAAPR